MNAFDNAIQSLQKVFDEAIKFDTWGQRLEASEHYQKFDNEFNDLERPKLDEVNEKKLSKILTDVRRRAEILDKPNQTEDVNLQQMQTDFKDAVLPPCNRNSGQTYLTIKIEKIGLKDAVTYVDPLFTVSVRDDFGRNILPEQNTRPSENVQAKCIVYNTDIHIQKSMEELPKNFAVFFEFKHFKEKKQKVSVRCFALIERDEIKNGCTTIELYKKPVDYTRKKLYLFTEKPLYLHLFLNLAKA